MNPDEALTTFERLLGIANQLGTFALLVAFLGAAWVIRAFMKGQIYTEHVVKRLEEENRELRQEQRSDERLATRGVSTAEQTAAVIAVMAQMNAETIQRTVRESREARGAPFEPPKETPQ